VIEVDRFLFGRDVFPIETSGLSIISKDIRKLDKDSFGGGDAVIDLAALCNDPSGELVPQKTWQTNH